MTDVCPTCGAPLSGQFSWSLEQRTFSTRSARVVFTEIQALIFDAVWKAGKTGMNDRAQFMWAVYGERADGGPSGFNALAVHLVYMRRILEPIGYTITPNVGTPRQGWRLVKISRDRA